MLYLLPYTNMLYIDIQWEKEGEVWKPHPIYDYSFSSFGRPKNNKTGKIGRITSYPHSLYVGNYVRKYLHRLVYESWYGPIPEGLLVQHYEENLPQPFLNSPSNLSLGTDQTNMIDRKNKDRGNRPIGSLNPHTKLTEEEVLEMRRLWTRRRTDIGPNSSKQPVSYKTLQEKYGVSKDIVYNIINKNTWSHI